LRFRLADAPNACGGERRERVGDDVTPGKREHKPRAFAVHDQRERRAQRSAVFNFFGAIVRRLFDSVGQHAPGRDCRKSRNPRIIGVQYRDGTLAVQAFNQLAFRQRDFIH